MGLRSWVTGLFGEEGNAAEAADDADDGQLELTVDVERRAGSMLEHYGLSGEDARQITEILAAELAREEG